MLILNMTVVVHRLLIQKKFSFNKILYECIEQIILHIGLIREIQFYYIFKLIILISFVKRYIFRIKFIEITLLFLLFLARDKWNI